jgi:hypothetical protein
VQGQCLSLPGQFKAVQGSWLVLWAGVSDPAQPGGGGSVDAWYCLELLEAVGASALFG